MTTLQQELRPCRNALLDLHKALIGAERAAYESTTGVIESPARFLDLLVNDPWFAWLLPLSQLIVMMDEALNAKEPVVRETVNALIDQMRRLLAPSGTGGEYAGRYFEALQRDPGAVLAHAAAVAVAGPRKTPP